MTQGAPFHPTEEHRRTVRAMSGYDVPQDDIATMLRIDPKTLRKHFRDELERGSIEATAKVGQSLFRMATEGGSVAAAIFWMKARAGWREKQVVEVQSRLPVEQLLDEELERLIRGGLADYADELHDQHQIEHEPSPSGDDALTPCPSISLQHRS
jgi:hypothetical protein